MEKEFTLTIEQEFHKKRIDTALAALLPDITRSSCQKHLKTLLVNGTEEKLSYKCKTGDSVFVRLEWEEQDVAPEDIPLHIVFEDENYIVINKEAGMVVHPAQGNYSGTLVNALMGMQKDLSEQDDESRPGIVHRIDKDTSGLILIAKNIKSHNYLSALFREREIYKEYTALVKGFYLPSKHTIQNKIGRDPKHRKRMAVVTRGGKEAVSTVEVLTHFAAYSLVKVEIKTGRTHQIRVHLSHHGFPILGDPLYARKDSRFPDVTMCLLASRIRFFDIFTGKEFDFSVPFPSFFADILEKLKSMH